MGATETFMISRRSFLAVTGATVGASVTRMSAQRGRGGAALAGLSGPLPPSIEALTSMRARAKPITAAERVGRLEKARKLMAEQKIDAIILAGGTSLTYFTGIRWGNSERLTAVVIPKVGNPYIVTPAFEEDRTREQLVGGPVEHTDVAIWQEDESPFALVAQGLKDRGIATGRIGVEETTKFVFADSMGDAAPALKVVSATPITAGCRMIKDAHEIELMKLACEATLKCYQAVYRALKPGMTQNEVGALLTAGFGRLGFPGGASVQVGEYTALPHGSITPQTIREGTIIMMDNGCSAEGYQSDITRTYVLGKATEKMKKVFEIVY
jgi:Xaa-Pro aminopeptidase